MSAIDVKGKIILITGANRGIGKAIAEAMIARGAGKIYAAVRNPDSAAALVDTHGDKVVPLDFDLADEDSIRQAAARASDVDIVVNSAGVFRATDPLADTAIEAIQFEIDRNVYGLMRTAQAFAPVLKTNGGGAFVQLNSVASLRCFADFTTYSASKAAAYSVTQGLRVSLAEQGTQVVSVHPGPIATDMANQAGLTEIAEPPSVVADAIIEALEHERFHVFPDGMAREVGAQFAGFAENVIEPMMAEA